MSAGGHVLGCVKKFRGVRIGWRNQQWELKTRPTPTHLVLGWWAGPVATPRPVVRADGGARTCRSWLKLQAVREGAVGAPPGAAGDERRGIADQREASPVARLPSPTRPACGRRRVASVESRAGNGSPCVRALNELRVAREGPVAELPCGCSHSEQPDGSSATGLHGGSPSEPPGSPARPPSERPSY